MEKTKLKRILLAHRKWLHKKKGGKWAVFSLFEDLENADFTGADLRGISFCNVNLRGARFDFARVGSFDKNNSHYFCRFRNANLENADLSKIIFESRPDFMDAKLTGAKLPDYLIVPKEGSFIGYKKVRGNVILKLEILGNRMNSLGSRKCRTDKVRVLESLGGGSRSRHDYSGFRSRHDYNFIYQIGKIAKAPLDSDIRVECASGIHFFMTEQEAREYEY